MEKLRFQVEVTPDQEKLLQAVMKDAGLHTKKELFNSALSLFYWAVQRSKEGRSIASMAPDEKSWRELEVPSLLILRDKAKDQVRAKGEEPNVA